METTHSDIVAEVKAENPQAENGELAKLINDRLKAANLTKEREKPVLEPVNTSQQLTGQLKGQAENISKRKNLMVQFVRPKGTKTIGATINFMADDVRKIKKIVARKSPVGALVAFLDGPDIIIGWSKRHPSEETEPFTKKDATLIAIMRGLTDGIKANEAGFYETSSGRALPRAINKAVETFAKRASAYFKGEFRNIEFI